ncbi:metalloprotease PmbA [Pleionea litopenaei]|uniref:Metalloprotease PmbA n=1 Tax=Pleionea litopenaei TaxID=3070815 RepID=A0AA51RT00_9GAMM|nr:metalloprotease PmbA [Pleionea sp. HL-JVS1]WMS87108.1 metalloprotease PmbA [Pleionea sp. HL-JVS1]
MQDTDNTALSVIDMDEKLVNMREVCEQILALAASKGASSAEVGVSQDTGITVQARARDIETVEFNQDGSFGISVYFGQKKGTASTTDTSQRAIEQAVEAACNFAKYTSADPFAGLADAELMATKIEDLSLDHPSDVSVDVMKQMVLDCEAAGLDVAGIYQSDSTSISAHRNARVYANSHGFIGDSSSTRYSLSSVLIAQDEQGMKRDYWYTLGRKFEQLESAQVVGTKAAERVLSHLNGRVLKTQKAPIMFTPEMARGVIGHFLNAIRGSALYNKASFLVDAKGQQLFPDFVQIDERPHLIGGLASSYFDNEGVATNPRHIVQDGVLQGYVLNSYAARKMQTQTTANAGGLHNVFISHQDLDFNAMLQELGTGFLVTDLMGQGVNVVTGDYSRGASGFWVEKGVIQFPVHEVTIAGNLKQMLQNIRCIGKDQDLRSAIVSGSMIIDGMTVAGQ